MTGKNIIDFINKHHLENAYLEYINDCELVLTLDLNGSIKKSLDYKLSNYDESCEYYCNFERKDGEDDAVFCNVTFDEAVKIRDHWDRKNGGLK